MVCEIIPEYKYRLDFIRTGFRKISLAHLQIQPLDEIIAKWLVVWFTISYPINDIYCS